MALTQTHFIGLCLSSSGSPRPWAFYFIRSFLREINNNGCKLHVCRLGEKVGSYGRNWFCMEEMILYPVPFLASTGKPLIKASSRVEQQLWYFWFGGPCFIWEQFSNQGWQKSGSSTDLWVHTTVKGIWCCQSGIAEYGNLVWLRVWIAHLELFLSLSKIACSQLSYKVNKLYVGRLLALQA